MKLVKIDSLAHCPHRDPIAYFCGKVDTVERCILGDLPAGETFPAWCPLKEARSFLLNDTRVDREHLHEWNEVCSLCGFIYSEHSVNDEKCPRYGEDEKPKFQGSGKYANQD